MRMATEACPELARLVERLAEAMNERKRVEGDDHHSTEARMSVDERMNAALEAMRAHKAEHHCELSESGNNSQPTA